MIAKILGAAVAVAMMAAAPPASARIVTVTFTGTVATVDNPDGLWNSPSLGETIVTSMTFDTSQAYGSYSDGSENNIWGGTGYGGPQFILSASATINGVVYSVASPNYGSLSSDVYPSAPYSGVIGNGKNDVANGGASYTSTSVMEGANSSSPSLPFPYSLTTSYSYTLGPNDVGMNEIAFVNDNFVTDLWQFDNIVGNVTNVTVVVGAPEPSTWAMLLLGFAGLGFAGYRRARTAA